MSRCFEGWQNCFFCEDFKCYDNLNQERKKMSQETKTREEKLQEICEFCRDKANEYMKKPSSGTKEEKEFCSVMEEISERVNEVL